MYRDVAPIDSSGASHAKNMPNEMDNAMIYYFPNVLLDVDWVGMMRNAKH